MRASKRSLAPTSMLRLFSGGAVVPAPESLSPGVPPVNVHGCLTRLEVPDSPDEAHDGWTVLHAPGPGTYRIAAPYALSRGTDCPDELSERDRQPATQ